MFLRIKLSEKLEDKDLRILRKIRDFLKEIWPKAGGSYGVFPLSLAVLGSGTWL